MSKNGTKFRYSWVLFDADHTLFDFDRAAEKSISITAQEFGIEQPLNYQEYHQINRRCWEEYERGEIDRETLRYKRFKEFFLINDISADPLSFHDQYLDRLAKLPYLMDYALEILEHLHGRVKMGIVTNGLPEVQRPRLKNAKLTRKFDVILVAGEVGVAKPQPAYFDLAFQEMGSPSKEEVIIIGDSTTSDIKGGEQYGIDTCWFNPTKMENRAGVQPTFEIKHLSELHSVLELSEE
jgi:YjjG family noncanonical pyrimidine nucleotidase